MTLLAITPAGYVLLGLLLFCFWLTYRIIQRMKGNDKSQKSGCSFIYVWIVVFSLGALSIWVSYTFIINTVNDVMTVTNGRQYKAELVDWTSEWETTTDDNGDTTRELYHTPILEFTTIEGVVLKKKVNYSSPALPDKGKIYTIYYNEKQDYMFVWSYHSILLFFILLLMGIIFSFGFYGTIRYALGYSMDGYTKTVKSFVLKFLVPFSLIGFEIAFICALFSAGSILTVIVLLFAIVILSTVICGWFVSWRQKKLL